MIRSLQRRSVRATTVKTALKLCQTVKKSSSTKPDTTSSKDLELLNNMGFSKDTASSSSPTAHDSVNETDKQEADVFSFSKRYETLDSTSIQTMEKILDILQLAQRQTTSSAETDQDVKIVDVGEEAKPYQNAFATELGKEVLEYSVVRLLNDIGIVSPAQSPGKNVRQLYYNYISEFSRLLMKRADGLEKFADKSYQLNRYQLITKSFVEHDSQCMQILRHRLMLIAKNELDIKVVKPEYAFPKVLIPPPYPYDPQNPLVLMKSFSIKRQTNILPFVFNDPVVIRDFFTKNAAKRRAGVLHPGLIQTLIEAQELEGSMIYLIMMKKCLLATDQLKNQNLLDTLINSDSIKPIIACKSRIPERLFSLNRYKNALANSRIMEISEKDEIHGHLEAQFNRFFGVFYRANAQDTEKWVKCLIEFFLKNQQVDNGTFGKEPVAYFKDFITSIELEANKAMWA